MIRGLLDTDLYKLTMGQAIQKLFPRAVAKYVFTDRNDQRDFSERFIARLQTDIKMMGHLRLRVEEVEWLRKTCPYLEPWYIDWLSQFQFKPEQVQVSHSGEGQLLIEIAGPWCETVYWEVPLMATICRLYYEIVAGVGQVAEPAEPNMATVAAAHAKAAMLSEAGCKYADFGTRRRRDRQTQGAVVKVLSEYPGNAFIGTSNVALAQYFDIRPIGTMAHEWIMGVGAMRGLRYANKYAMADWNKVYHGRLGIALSDTYGTKAFLNDFDGTKARLFDGVRQDSGSPEAFIRMMCQHYAKLGIPLSGKTLIFSDGLDVDRAVDINEVCHEHAIGAAFGIGTNLTNDDPDSPPLNIVIKLHELNGIPLAKLSDDPDKATGHPDAIKEARYVFMGRSL